MWTVKFKGIVVVDEAGDAHLACVSKETAELVGRGHSGGDIKLTPHEFEQLQKRGEWIRPHVRDTGSRLLVE